MPQCTRTRCGTSGILYLHRHTFADCITVTQPTSGDTMHLYLVIKIPKGDQGNKTHRHIERFK